MKKRIIYFLDNDVSNKGYVGKSSSRLYRPKAHGAPSNLKVNGHLPVIRWIEKYRRIGIEYRITVLEECESEKDLVEAERFYIAYFRTIGMDLLNLTDGGEGISGYKFDPVVYDQKIAAKKRGKPRSPEVRAKLSAANTGKKQSTETVAKRVVKLKGQKRSPEICANFSMIQNTPEVKAKMVAALTGREITWGDKISAARTGQKASNEAKINIARGLKNRPPEVYEKGWTTRRAKQIPRIRINLLGAA